MAPSEFTTILSSPRAEEVRLYQGVLAAQGIESFVDNENHVSMAPHLAPALGGVRLRVRTVDAGEAVRILKALVGENDRVVCPHCGSTRVQATPWSVLKIIGTFLLFCIPLLLPRRYQCRDCGRTWRR